MSCSLSLSLPLRVVSSVLNLASRSSSPPSPPPPWPNMHKYQVKTYYPGKRPQTVWWVEWGKGHSIMRAHIWEHIGAHRGEHTHESTHRSTHGHFTRTILYGWFWGLCWPLLGLCWDILSSLLWAWALHFGFMQSVGQKTQWAQRKKMAVLLMLFMLCLTMFARYFSVLRWHLDCDFGGVWCLDVTSIHNRQYQTILHTCGQWHLQSFSCPDCQLR